MWCVVRAGAVQTGGCGDVAHVGERGELLLGVAAGEVQAVLRAAEVLHGELRVVRHGRAARAPARVRGVARVRPLRRTTRRR